MGLRVPSSSCWELLLFFKVHIKHHPTSFCSGLGQHCSIHNSLSSAFIHYSSPVKLWDWFFLISFKYFIQFRSLSELPGVTQAPQEGLPHCDRGRATLQTRAVSKKQPESSVMLHKAGAAAVPAPLPDLRQPG